MADRVLEIRAVGGDYPSQNALKTAESGFDVTSLGANSDLIIYIYNDWAGGLNERIQWDPADFVTGTGSDNQVYIIGVGGTEGSDAPLLINNTAASQRVVQNNHLYIHYSNFRISNTGTNSSSSCISTSGGDLSRLDCTTSGFGSGSHGIILIDTGARTATVESCLVHDVNGEGYSIGSFSECNIYNCGAAEVGAIGFNKQGTSRNSTVSNCWVFNRGGGGTGYTNTSALLGSNNASFDTSTSGTSPTNNILSAAFTDQANSDWTPAASGVLDGGGIDLSGTVDTDLSGNSFTAPYEIGPFAITAGGPDTTPDSFSFTDQTDVALSSQIESNVITVAGIDSASAISVTAGEYRINAGSYVSTAGTVSNGDTVQLRQTSSGSYSTLTSVTLDIGGVTDQWDVTTLADAGGSSLTITITDIPDGNHETFFQDVTNDANITKQTLTYASGSATASLSVPAGTEVVSAVKPTDTKANSGGADIGTTV